MFGFVRIAALVLLIAASALDAASAQDRVQDRIQDRASDRQGHHPGQFDFYVMALSRSPSF
jgi:ribonuclease I